MWPPGPVLVSRSVGAAWAGPGGEPPGPPEHASPRGDRLGEGRRCPRPPPGGDAFLVDGSLSTERADRFEAGRFNTWSAGTERRTQYGSGSPSMGGGRGSPRTGGLGGPP